MDQLDSDSFRPSPNLQQSPTSRQHVRTNHPQTPPLAASRIRLPTTPTPPSRIPVPTTRSSSSRNPRVETPSSSRRPSSQIDPSLLETIFFNNPLRHLASHSSVNSYDSGEPSRSRSRSRSRSVTTRSHARLGSTSTVSTSEAGPASQNRYAFSPRRERPLRPHARNFEEQRHDGKPNLSITRNTKRYDPHYERGAGASGSSLKAETNVGIGASAGRVESWRAYSTNDRTGGYGNRIEALRSEAALARGGTLRPENAAGHSTHLGPVGAGGGVHERDGTTMFEDHRKESLPTREKVDEEIPGAALENLAPPETKEEEDENEYPGPLGLIFLSIGLMLCVFLISLDRTIITPVSLEPGVWTGMC